MVWVFLAFASAYFLSALIRAITATLSPTLTQELSLSAQDLGLLAGGYFLGFRPHSCLWVNGLTGTGLKKFSWLSWLSRFWVAQLLRWPKVSRASGLRGFCAVSGSVLV